MQGLLTDVCLNRKRNEIVCDVLQERDLVKGKSTLTDLQNKYSGTVFLSYRETVNKRGGKKISQLLLAVVVFKL